jgi:hypothetical protein
LQVGPNLVQHFDVEAAESYKRRTTEKMKFIARSAKTPKQIRDVRARTLDFETALNLDA